MPTTRKPERINLSALLDSYMATFHPVGAWAVVYLDDDHPSLTSDRVSILPITYEEQDDAIGVDLIEEDSWRRFKAAFNENGWAEGDEPNRDVDCVVTLNVFVNGERLHYGGRTGATFEIMVNALRDHLERVG